MHAETACCHASFGDKSKAVIGTATFKPDSSPPPFAVCWARAVVDMRTGMVRVPDVIICADVGRAIDPRVVRGQLQGGALMGVGYATAEQVYLDKTQGS